MTEPTAEQTAEVKPAKKRYTVADPDDLTLAQAMGIKAATGVDVFAPESQAHLVAAMIFYAGRHDGLTFLDACTYTSHDFDLPSEVPDDSGADPLDPQLDADAGPTPGSGSPTDSSS